MPLRRPVDVFPTGVVTAGRQWWTGRLAVMSF